MFFDSSSSVPIYKQISAKIVADIQDGILKKDDSLMSINEFSDEHEIARDTVEKAYRELREKGIIRSVKGKGYFISEIRNLDKIRIFLHFNKISTYKKKIYDSFIKEIGEAGTVDLFIHHDDKNLFESQLSSAIGNYNQYVIIPPDGHLLTDQIPVFKKIANKLLFLDKQILVFESQQAVYQDFDNDIFEALIQAKVLLTKYRKLTLVFPRTKGYASEVMDGFSKGCQKLNIPFEIVSDIYHNKVNKGKAFVVIEEEDLVELIKIIQTKNLEIGVEIGIISYNETPLKEILANGITVISTDFQKMGQKAAQIILKNEKGNFKNPFNLIVRKSL